MIGIIRPARAAVSDRWTAQLFGFLAGAAIARGGVRGEREAVICRNHKNCGSMLFL